MLAALAAHLPGPLLAEAVEVARAIGDEWERSRALAALAARLAELGRPTEALETARAIGSDWQRTLALAALAAHLAEGPERDQTLRQALEAARAVGVDRSRSEALATLAPHLGGPLLAEALETARAIGDEGERSRALAALAPRLAKLPPKPLDTIWCQTLRSQATCSRKDLLEDLVALVPVIAALGGVEAVAGMPRAIRDVVRWWP